MRFNPNRFYVTTVHANGLDYWGPFQTITEAKRFAKSCGRDCCYIDKGKPALAL